MIPHAKNRFLVLAVAVATIAALNHEQNNKFDVEGRRISDVSRDRYRRGVFKWAGRKVAQLLNAAEELAHHQHARSVLKADAVFIRKQRLYEKTGGTERAKQDFLLMDVRNVEIKTVDKGCVLKEGVIGRGTVRFMNCKGKSPIIVFKRNPSSNRRSLTIQVRYKD